MLVELLGGPLDGTVIDGMDRLPYCVSLPTDLNEVWAVYQAQCGCRCHYFTDSLIRYYFCGYDMEAIDTVADAEVGGSL